MEGIIVGYLIIYGPLFVLVILGVTPLFLLFWKALKKVRKTKKLEKTERTEHNDMDKYKVPLFFMTVFIIVSGLVYVGGMEENEYLIIYLMFYGPLFVLAIWGVTPLFLLFWKALKKVRKTKKLEKTERTEHNDMDKHEALLLLMIVFIIVSGLVYFSLSMYGVGF